MTSVYQLRAMLHGWPSVPHRRAMALAHVQGCSRVGGPPMLRGNSAGIKSQASCPAPADWHFAQGTSTFTLLRSHVRCVLLCLRSLC